MITPSQILLSTLIIFVITRTFIAYKKGSLSGGFTFLWIIFWLGGLFLIWQQQLAIEIAHRLGISRGVDLVIYVSLIIIFYLIYRLMVWMNEIDRKITELVRKIALKGKKR